MSRAVTLALVPAPGALVVGGAHKGEVAESCGPVEALHIERDVAKCTGNLVRFAAEIVVVTALSDCLACLIQGHACDSGHRVYEDVH